MSSERVVLREMIEKGILVIRDKKVMLDRDLAVLYEVPTKVLNQAVKRNRERFPADFMFQLSPAELRKWRSQLVTSNAKMGVRRAPFAFTEHGILMLSSVLNSRRAIEVNIQIMRTFVRLRELMQSHKELWKKIQAMENKYDGQFKIVFDALRSLLVTPEKNQRKIGFTAAE
jgi:hypothetical protein